MVALSETNQTSSKNGHRALYASGIAAILASTCHHISFLLTTLGLSNTKILYIVTLADWGRPFLITVAIIALFISYERIWRVFSTHQTGRDNTNSQTKVTDKVFFLFVAILVVIVLMLPYFLPCVE